MTPAPLENLKSQYLADISQHRQKYQRIADEAKQHSDNHAWRDAQIKLGVLRMCEGLFSSRYQQNAPRS